MTPNASDPRKGNEEQSNSWWSSLTAGTWSQYTDPQTVLPVVISTSAILLGVGGYRRFLRRIPEAAYFPPKQFRSRSLFGRVTRVGDGDNFHLYHTPGGRMAGWGWLRTVPEKAADLKKRTVAVRIAGIDAPEGAHFGKEAQPHSAESLAWLREYILNRRVRAHIYKRDQYDRLVATVYIRRFLFRKDVGLEMLKAGIATVYEAKSGAEFGNLEDKYRAAEVRAKAAKKGMWAGSLKDYESPREYKRRNNIGDDIRKDSTPSSPSILTKILGSKKS